MSHTVFFRACGGLFLQISVYKFKSTRISRLQQSIPQSGIQKKPTESLARFLNLRQCGLIRRHQILTILNSSSKTVALIQLMESMDGISESVTD